MNPDPNRLSKLLNALTAGKKSGPAEPFDMDEFPAEQRAELDVLTAAQRADGLAKLVGQLETMIEESGDPSGFDAVGWMSRWLSEPLPALGGRKPSELLNTMERQAILAQMLAQMQSGAFA